MKRQFKELPIPPKPPKKAKRTAVKLKTAAKPKTATKPSVTRKAKSTPRKRNAVADKRRDLIVSTLDKMKAEDIVTLDVADQCSFADTMVIASGRSQRHVTSLADDVVRALKEKDTGVYSVEGKPAGDWVLIDAGSVIVHIFRPETRQFYNIEKMWAIPAPTTT
jgi:ribosome-associated protein